MKESKIILRHAQEEDAPIVALAVAMAIDDNEALHDYCGDNPLSVLTEIARAEATQYSWRFAIVAESEGEPVGAVVGYDGARLKELREGTFAVLRRLVGRVPNINDETEAGEYYLDSVAVLPEFVRSRRTTPTPAAGIRVSNCSPRTSKCSRRTVARSRNCR